MQKGDDRYFLHDETLTFSTHGGRVNVLESLQLPYCTRSVIQVSEVLKQSFQMKTSTFIHISKCIIVNTIHLLNIYVFYIWNRNNGTQNIYQWFFVKITEVLYHFSRLSLQVEMVLFTVVIKRCITHYQFTQWPDSGVPSENRPLAQMLHLIVCSHDESKSPRLANSYPN